MAAEAPRPLTVHLQAVPQRQAYIEQVILPAIERGGSQVEQVAVWYDHHRHGPLWNATRIWNAVAVGPEMGLVLQDDVLLHADFWEHIPDILRHMENGVMEAVSLFAPPRKSTLEALSGGFNFIETYNFLWMPGMVLSPQFCRGLLGWMGEHPSATVHDDVVLGCYARECRIPIWVTVPSLVQHDLNVKSAMGTPAAIAGMKRRSPAWRRAVAPRWYLPRRGVKEGLSHGD